jgi:hypothetical protein
MFLSAFSHRPKARNRLAYVFYATDDIHAMAVLVFVRLLRELGARSDADIVVMHAPLSSALREKMQRWGITIRLVRRYPKAMNTSFRCRSRSGQAHCWWRNPRAPVGSG